MAFCPYGVTWPTLSSFSCEYQGNSNAAVVMGASSVTFSIQPGKMEGFDLQTVEAGDPNRARQRGQYIGLDLMAGRDITLTMDVGPALGSYGSTTAALNALRRATNAASTDPGSYNTNGSGVLNNTNPGETEWPLWVQFPNQPLVASMCRPVRRNIPVDMAFSIGNMVQGVAVQWHSTDPYFYAATVQNTATAITLPGSPSFSPNNTGDVECWPQYTITGPCTNPQLENNSIGAALLFNLTMNSGDTLVVDNDLRTATYTPSGGQPTSVIYTLNTGWSWWPLIPGSNDVTFSASTASGTISFTWAPAFSSAI